jgi:hypothetical protein
MHVLAHILVQEPSQWTGQTSWVATETFPHVKSLKLTGCAISLDALDPLLHTLNSLTLHRSQLCTSGPDYDPNWPLQLLGAYPISKIELKGTFAPVQHPLDVDLWIDLSPNITHLTVHENSLGAVQDWLQVLMGLPDLQYYEYCPEAGATNVSARAHDLT